ncbi:MAG TPA: hypothetical protein EYP52_02850 [Anaerolineae bacterium]|nr:hypothetical protein [Anaerolineae bacterium]
MPAIRKVRIRELATAAYELDAGVVYGRLHRNPDDGRWMVGETPLNTWLERFADQEVYVIVASLEDDRPLPVKVCRTCGTEYAGPECPRCRTVRIRLRGG